jgi:hypothetical protein
MYPRLSKSLKALRPRLFCKGNERGQGIVTNILWQYGNNRISETSLVAIEDLGRRQEEQGEQIAAIIETILLLPEPVEQRRRINPGDKDAPQEA